jgi:hypothetical protein
MAKPNFEIRNEEIEGLLKEIGSLIDGALHKFPDYGFTLMLFTYGEGGELFYISSAQRKDMIRAMQEFQQKFGEN